MIIEIEYRDRFGGKNESIKKIPDMKESDIEKYVRKNDIAVHKVINLKVRK